MFFDTNASKMRNGRREAYLVKEYAEKTGIALRTAQMHRTKSSPQWLSFLADRIGNGAPSIPTQEDYEPMSLEEEEAQAAHRYASLHALLRDAIEVKDFSLLSSLLRVTGETHKLLVQVRTANNKLREEMGELIQVKEVSEYILGNLAMVKKLMENLPDVLAAKIESKSDVAEIVQSEVFAIFRELSSAAKSVPWQK